ncbi:NUDIX domain-containing protein [Streptomyces sp. NPDC058818]|uniref:NUDIX domain-containing protein n=1 Tax=Streptomyces sp. NPDC058818 TaxID=3346640 RepID=UPI0036C46ED3
MGHDRIRGTWHDPRHHPRSGPAHRRTPAAGGSSVSGEPHLLIADVAQVLLRSNGAALCVHRKLDAALAPGQLTVVGGHLQAGEPLDHAARREAQEEAGVLISAEQQEFCGLIHHHDADGELDRITAVFVAQSWTGEPYNAEPDKHEGLFWVPLEKPPRSATPTPSRSFTCLPMARPTGPPTGLREAPGEEVLRSGHDGRPAGLRRRKGTVRRATAL